MLSASDSLSVLSRCVFIRSKTIVGRVRTMATSSSTMASIPAIKQNIDRPRRFAPLDSSKANKHNAPSLRGIVFDVDGTLCLPQNYMFKEMRAALSIPKSEDILEHIRSLSNEPDGKPLASPGSTTDDLPISNTEFFNSSPQTRAVYAIRAIERRAMNSQRPQPGLVELMTYLTSKSIPKALCTRNFFAPVYHLLENYLPSDQGNKFHPIITRDTEGILPKPSPEGIWKIAEAWGLDKQQTSSEEIRAIASNSTTARDGVNASQQHQNQVDVLELAKRILGSGLIMVGDSIDDMAAGYRAGAATVLLVNEENGQLANHEYTDLSIRSLDELVGILEEGFEGKA